MSEKQAEKKLGTIETLKLLCNMNFILVLVHACLRSAGTLALGTVISKFGNDVGASVTMLATITSAATVVMILARPLSGRGFDKLNKRTWLVFINLFEAAAFILIGLSHGVYWFFAARILERIGFCFITTSTPAMGGVILNKKTTGLGLSLLNAVPGLVVAFVPQVSLHIYETFGGSYSLFFAGGLAALAAVPLYFVKWSRKEAKEEKVQIVQDQEPKKKFQLRKYVALSIIPICVMKFFLTILMNTVNLILILYADSIGLKGAEIWFSINSAFQVVATLLVGFFYDRKGLKAVLPFCLLCCAGASFILGGAATVAPIAIASVLYTLAQNGSLPALQSASMKAVREDEAGAAVATLYLFTDLCAIVGSMIPAFLTEHFGYRMAFGSTAVFPILGLILFAVMYKKYKPFHE
ncbi:MFS transporter [Diplocloster hominis]|uniref:MFS transporter n=1 Tax=Diplocloster hominis TaxID=3079010 RepID=UPI0031BAD4C2